MLILKQSTAVDVIIGPFVDSTNGDSEETGLTIANTDVLLSKNGQTMAAKNDVTSCSHDAKGMYNCELDATDTNTVGNIVIFVHVSGALAVRHELQIVEEAVYDDLFGGSAAGYAGISELADVPTNSEFNARTLLASAYFDPTADTVANVTLCATTTTNTDMRGTNGANTVTPDAAGTAPTVTEILTTQMTESYAGDGVAPTLAQCLFLIQQSIGDFAIAGTVITTKRIDGSTTAATYTLDDGTNPTSRTRAS